MSTIVVTGASQGIGEAISLALAGPGETLCLVARNRNNLERVAESCRKRGSEAHVFTCDVTDRDAVRRMAAQLVDQAGVPDVLVNNAGAFVPGSLVETTLETFEGQMSVNLTSAFLVTRAFLPGMTKAGSGRILFMGSVASVRGYPGGVAYCVAKHAVLGLSRAVREETKEAGIQVTTLLPGATMSPSWEGVDIPEERFMPAEDIAEAVRSIVSMSSRTAVEEILLRPQLGDL